jgi:hypothetical protein
MKISKGAWIGLFVTILWMIGVALSFSFCKWNPVCSSGTDHGLFCTICTWLFFVPAVIVVTSMGYVLKMFGLPDLFVVNLICAIISAILIGMTLGAVLEKMISKLRSKTPSNPPAVD